MAWTQPPRTWTDGELVTASIMNAHVREQFDAVQHLIVRKTADETVTSSVALQNDDHLLAALAANEVWLMRGGDIKVAFTLPASATMTFGNYWSNTAGTAVTNEWGTSGTSLSLQCGTEGVMVIEGHVACAGTAGNIQLQWAQATSNAAATTVHTHSSVWGMLV
jgi:hypothetical protein